MNRHHKTPMRQKPILRVVSKILIPFILLFGLYVQFHGDFGPGGGFQAGVIFAAAFILFAMIYGLNKMRELANPRLIEILVASGVLLYGVVGILTMLLHGNFLEYGVLAHIDPLHPTHGQHRGILWIEAGVGITVAAAMIAIFDAFAARGKK